MTPEDWWYVGSRLLGIYFVVLGAMTATNALMMVGMVLPDGSRRDMLMVTPLIQGIISAGAGAWLLKRPAVRSGTEPAGGVPAGGVFRRAMQLLGVFFLLTGASELVKTAIDGYFVGEHWAIRASNVAAGVINASGGALLLLKPGTLAEKLDRVRR